MERPFYERVHGSAPTPLPGLPKVLELLWALEIFPDVTMLSPETALLDTDREGALEHLRRRLSVEEGNEKPTIACVPPLTTCWLILPRA